MKNFCFFHYSVIHDYKLISVSSKLSNHQVLLANIIHTFFADITKSRYTDFIIVACCQSFICLKATLPRTTVQQLQVPELKNRCDLSVVPCELLTACALEYQHPRP